MSNPRLLHPLMGSNFQTLSSLFSRNGTGRYPLHLAVILMTATLRWPFSAYERWRVEQTAVSEAATDAPIFIVGHWRSGTTFLYNVLSRSPQFAYLSPLSTGLPWDFLTLGALLRPLLEKALPKGRFIDQVPVNPDSPQEDEIALASMQPVSFYHGLYFPKNFSRNFDAGIFFDDCSELEKATWCWSMKHLCKKLQIQNPGRQLLIKNPVYTARIQRLLNLWPEAKFIHIYRNPYIVYQSTLNFYQKLFRQLALQPFEHLDMESKILESYPRMMNALLTDTAELPNHQFVELQFEVFEAHPMKALRQIYSQLELANWELAEPHFHAYLADQKSYRKNQYSFQPETMERVRTCWHPFIRRWNYDSPIS